MEYRLVDITDAQIVAGSRPTPTVEAPGDTVSVRGALAGVGFLPLRDECGGCPGVGGVCTTCRSQRITRTGDKLFEAVGLTSTRRAFVAASSRGEFGPPIVPPPQLEKPWVPIWVPPERFPELEPDINPDPPRIVPLPAGGPCGCRD